MIDKLKIRGDIFRSLGVILLLVGLSSDLAAGQDPALRYARGFSVQTTHSGCKLITVHPSWRDDAAPLRYLLVPRGKSAPSNHPPARVIFVPVQRVVSLSTTHLAYLDAAGQTDRLVGLADFKYVNTPSVRQRIAAGELKAVGHFTSLRLEPLLDLSADLILTPASGSSYDVHPKLIEAGLPAVLVIDHLETHPLGRCEWIKFLALFFDTGAHAETLFNQIADRYAHLAKTATHWSHRPTVLTGAPFQGQWWVARGDSFVSQFIRDAGGDYLWSDTPGAGSLPMDAEAVYERALDADVWLNTGNWRQRNDALAADPRFAAIRALKQGRIYNNNKRLNPWGGNDYWESGMLRPDAVLADLMAILHPQRLPDHQLVYYRRLTQDIKR